MTMEGVYVTLMYTEVATVTPMLLFVTHVHHSKVFVLKRRQLHSFSYTTVSFTYTIITSQTNNDSLSNRLSHSPTVIVSPIYIFTYIVAFSHTPFLFCFTQSTLS